MPPNTQLSSAVYLRQQARNTCCYAANLTYTVSSVPRDGSISQLGSFVDTCSCLTAALVGGCRATWRPLASNCPATTALRVVRRSSFVVSAYTNADGIRVREISSLFASFASLSEPLATYSAFLWLPCDGCLAKGMSSGNIQSSVIFVTDSDRSTVGGCFHLWKSLLWQPTVVTNVTVTKQTWSKSFVTIVIELLLD